MMNDRCECEADIKPPGDSHQIIKGNPDKIKKERKL